MRKYLIPLVIFSLFSWAGLFYLFFKIPPSSETIKIGFLGMLFLSLFFSFSFVFFLLQTDFFKQREREAYPTAVRRGFFIALWVFLAGLLKLFEAANQFNFLLLLGILFLSEIYLSRK